MENPQYPNNPPPSPYNQRSASIPKQPPSHHSDNNDPTTAELRALDCNLASLCEHVQIEGFNSGSFSDIVVNAMGSTYHLHRLILSRSSYFRSFHFLIILLSNLFNFGLIYQLNFGEVFKCMFASPMTIYKLIYV